MSLSWDDPLPQEIAEKWTTYRQQLQEFEKIRISRNVIGSGKTVELHGFSDASSLAYSAVVYVRSANSVGEVTITIVAAKTKVAPLKPVSIPRLELCGALLLSRLLTLVKSQFNIEFSGTYAWCDSEIVLHWLSSPPRRWTTFVANRTSAILETTPRYNWRYVQSELNPADCASRGIPPSQLFNHHLWWNGPPWLSLSKEMWPPSKFTLSVCESESVQLEEKRVPKQVFATLVDGHTLRNLIEKISSWHRLQRIVAYCFRFIGNCRVSSQERIANGLSHAEIRQARITILKFVQVTHFSEDIRSLQATNQLPNKSKLLRYSAFLDRDGLLRIGGRIKHANVSYNIKHPIILPKSSTVSNLIIADIHQQYLHTGVSETFAIIRQRYWIMGSRNLIRSIVQRCKRCFMQRKLTSQQLMGDLPPTRIQPGRPFTNTGCDYAGPRFAMPKSENIKGLYSVVRVYVHKSNSFGASERSHY